MAIVDGDIYVLVVPESIVDRVTFYLDDPNMSYGAWRVEEGEPFDFEGGPLDFAHPFDTTTLDDGEHTITTVVDLYSGESVTLNATFTVGGEEPEPTATPEPEPTSTPSPSPTVTTQTVPVPTVQIVGLFLEIEGVVDESVIRGSTVLVRGHVVVSAEHGPDHGAGVTLEPGTLQELRSLIVGNGRSFAVVAAEVKKLAHDTRSATSQIASTIGELTREAGAVTAGDRYGIGEWSMLVTRPLLNPQISRTIGMDFSATILFFRW